MLTAILSFVSMVSNYKRKANSTYFRWTKTDMEKAVNAVKAGSTLREAAVTFVVPKSTLQRKVIINANKEEFTVGNKSGHPTVFNASQEKLLCNRLVHLEKIGCPLAPKDARNAAYQLAQKLHVLNKFNKHRNQAGKDWFKRFMIRNRTLSIRKPVGLSQARLRAMTKARVEHFFNLLKNLMEEKGINGGETIFNMDESGLPLNNRPSNKVIAKRGKRVVSKIMATERGENVTLIACCNAAGHFIPPGIIFKGVRMNEELQQYLPSESVVFMTRTSYNAEETFYKWLAHFNQHKNSDKCILVLDGHASHIKSLRVIEYCDANNISVICLPSHTSHMLQPLDISFFKTLKSYYFNHTNQLFHENVMHKFTKIDFCSIFTKAWRQTALREKAINGFRRSGIFPLNPAAPWDNAFPINDEGDLTDNISCDEVRAYKQSLPSPKKGSVVNRKLQDSFVVTSYDYKSNLKSKQFSRDDLKPAGHNRSMDLDDELLIGDLCQPESRKSIKIMDNVAASKSSNSRETRASQVSTCGYCKKGINDACSSKMFSWVRCETCRRSFHTYCVGVKEGMRYSCNTCSAYKDL